LCGADFSLRQILIRHSCDPGNVTSSLSSMLVYCLRIFDTFLFDGELDLLEVTLDLVAEICLFTGSGHS
jgi:hypothetical protein